MQVEQDTEHVHENYTQQAIAQVPQITHPDPFDSAAVNQLPQDDTPRVGRLYARLTERSQQDNVQLKQSGSQIRQPIVAVSQQQSSGASRQVPDHFSFMDISRSQVYVRNHSRSAQTSMQAKAVEGLPTRMIFTKACRVVKAMATIGLHELASWDRHTIHNGDQGIVEQEGIANETPQPLFYGP